MQFPNVAWATSQKRIAHYQLAAIVGMSESRFSRALNGRADFTSDEREKIADALNFPVDWLFREVVLPPLSRGTTL